MAVSVQGAPIRIEVKAPQGPAGPAGTTSWAGITGKPASFPNADVTAATSSATPNTLVRRDNSGSASFSFIFVQENEQNSLGVSAKILRFTNEAGGQLDVRFDQTDDNSWEVGWPQGTGTLVLSTDSRLADVTAAASNNSANTLVRRDANGDAGFNTITALQGNFTDFVCAAITVGEGSNATIVFSTATSARSINLPNASGTLAIERTQSRMLTSNVTRTSSTVTADATLSVPLLANTNYMIELVVSSQVATTGSLFAQARYSGTLDPSITTGSNASVISGVQAVFYAEPTSVWNSVSPPSSDLLNLNIRQLSSFKFFLRTATAGNFALFWSNSTGTGSATLLLGSSLIATQL